MQVKRKRNKKETGEHGVSSPSFPSNQSSHVQSQAQTIIMARQGFKCQQTNKPSSHLIGLRKSALERKKEITLGPIHVSSLPGILQAMDREFVARAIYSCGGRRDRLSRTDPSWRAAAHIRRWTGKEALLFGPMAIVAQE